MKCDCLQIQLIHCSTSVFHYARLFREIQLFLKLIHLQTPTVISEVRSNVFFHVILSILCVFSICLP